MPFLRVGGRKIGVGFTPVLQSGKVISIMQLAERLNYFRLATDLNLHHLSSSKPQSEKQEREILNKTRVWMICCNLDRSTATQFGKPSTIKEH